ncbi:MAG: type II toxin-antitoxin system RelE/ParE family toxin [Candidatus Angelobacter sp. Gp1-AA117]|nr:MAG: type II toxin-antitoxin system RelE/ParE family toxin [Candidatus Angelobacter sp. Gp1-AA117]
MKTFVLTALADRDLDQIWEYLAKDNIQTADRVLLAIEKAIHKIAKAPGIGHYRQELADQRHRFFLVYSYLVIYRTNTQPLQIIRVLHAARDIPNLLNTTL